MSNREQDRLEQGREQPEVPPPISSTSEGKGNNPSNPDPPAESDNNQQGTVVTLDLSPLSKETREDPIKFKPPGQIKEETATIIAKLIIKIFVGALIASFALQGIVIALAFKFPEQVTNNIVPAMGGNLLETVKLVGAIFSPLLAFILGYYFSISSKEKSESSNNKQ